MKIQEALVWDKYAADLIMYVDLVNVHHVKPVNPDQTCLKNCGCSRKNIIAMFIATYFFDYFNNHSFF